MFLRSILILFAFVVLISCIRVVTSKPTPLFADLTHPKFTTQFNASERLFKFQLMTSNDVDLDICKAQRHSERQVNRNKRALVTAKSERLWEFGVIPYEIDSKFSGSQRTLFKQAMRHWQNSTCLTFVERTKSEHVDYIIFTEKPCGCCSFVGRRGNGPQGISIGKGCDKFGTVVHELGHAIGFWHEHARLDRDEKVLVIAENIMTGQEFNFNKLTLNDTDNSKSDGVYDYNSIMHYARNTFSRSPFLDTIMPKSQGNSSIKSGSIQIGQRNGLSLLDIEEANKLYKCPTCGSTLLEPNGTFHSPNYFNGSGTSAESIVQGEMKCQWRIMATHGETIKVKIMGYGLVPCGHFDAFQNEQTVQVRDGYWEKSPLLGHLCGSKIESPSSFTFHSTGSRLILNYITPQSASRGFLANYEAICGGELTADSGHLESPNFPDEYLPSKNCLWKIIVPEGFQVALTFHSFEIESHSNCAFDFIEIRDDSANDSTSIRRFCGRDVPPLQMSRGNQMSIRFVSDESVQKVGFSASFVKEVDECAMGTHDCQQNCRNTIGSYRCNCEFGFQLNSDGKECEVVCGGVIEIGQGEKENLILGTLVSPSFPNLYPKNQNCVWEIRAKDPTSKIVLNFTHFDIEGTPGDCDYDSLQLINFSQESDENENESISGNGIGLFCGSSTPPGFTSEKNLVQIVFKSDDSIEKSGFSLNYFIDKDECALSNGGCSQNCENLLGTYKCLCEVGWTLELNMYDCRRNDLEVDDLDQMCNFEIDIPSIGQGEIQSPNFDWDEGAEYPPNGKCTWVIRSSLGQGYRVRILFDHFDIEFQEDCVYDHLLIHDGPTSESQLLGKFCGSKVPDYPIVGSTSYLFLVFISDGGGSGSGFHGRLSTVCGGQVDAEESEKYLYSHFGHGESLYPNNEECEWVIEKREDQEDGVILLSFITFDIEDSHDCSADVVQILSESQDDRDDYSTMTSLGRFCGNQLPPEFVSIGHSDSIIIKFKTDGTVTSKGFKASYRRLAQNPSKIPKIN